MRRLLVFVLSTIFLFISVLNVSSFETYKTLEFINSSKFGFWSGFRIFNYYPFGLFTSPQYVDVDGYSLGISVNNVSSDSLLSVVGGGKLFSYPFFVGFSFKSYSSEAYSGDFEFLGNFSQNFWLFGLGTKFSRLLSVVGIDFDLGTSVLLSIDNWSFPIGLYVYDRYYLESYFVPVVGVKGSTYFGFEFSLTQKLFLGGYLGRFSLGMSSEVGFKFSPISIFTSDTNFYRYLFIFPYVSYGFIQDSSEEFVNKFSQFRWGVGIVSEVFEWLRLSLGVGNKGVSFSIILEFFSSPLGTGFIDREGSQYIFEPSLFIIFGEKSVKSIIGITPDREYVDKGIVEYENGNFTNAIYNFEMALKINPSNEIALIYREKLRRWLESDELLTKEQQEYVKSLLTRAKVLKSEGKYSEALKEYRKVLDLNPYNKEAVEGFKEIENMVSKEVNKNYSEALSLYSRNELFEAKRVISKNLDLNPFHEPSLRLSKEIDDRIQTESARKLELEQRKNLSYSLYSQGLQELSSYNFPKALEFFNKAIEIYPENTEAREAVNRTVKEMENLSKTRENKARSELLVAEGRKLYSEGKLWEAVEKYREAIRFFRDNEIAKTELSNTIETIKSQANILDKEADDLFANGEVSRAFEKWDMALGILRDLPEAIPIKQKVILKKEELRSSTEIKLSNARDLLNGGNFVDAMKLSEVVLKLEPNNREAYRIYSEARKRFDSYVDSRITEGISLFDKKDFVNANNVFDEILKVLSENDSRYARVKKYSDETKSKLKDIEVSKSLEEKFKEVDAFLANYDYESAKKVLEEILTLDPKNETAKMRLQEVEKKSKEFILRDDANRKLASGLREIRKKNYVDGIKLLKEAREKLIALGDDVSLIDNYIKNAEDEFVLERDKSFKEGKQAYEKGDYLKARELLDIALKNNPNSLEIRTLLTEVNNRIKVFEKEVSERAEKRFLRGEYDDAMNDYSLLSKISPENELYKLKFSSIQSIKENISQVSNLIRLGKFSEALDIADRLISINPEDQNLRLLRDNILERLASYVSELKKEVNELMKREEYRKALNRLEVILKVDPSDVDAKSRLSFVKSKLDERINKNLNLGRSYYNSGNYKDAIKFLGLVLEDDPNNLLAKQLYDNARVRYNEIVAKDREKIQREIATFMSLGVDEYRKGNISRAIEYWQKVLELDPDNDQAKKYIARAKLGK